MLRRWPEFVLLAVALSAFRTPVDAQARSSAAEQVNTLPCTHLPSAMEEFENARERRYGLAAAERIDDELVKRARACAFPSPQLIKIRIDGSVASYRLGTAKERRRAEETWDDLFPAGAPVCNARGPSFSSQFQRYRARYFGANSRSSFNYNDFGGRPADALRKGLDQSSAGRFNAGAEAFRAAVIAAPNFQEAWLMLGLAYQSLGKRREAIEAFTNALVEYDPPSPEEVLPTRSQNDAIAWLRCSA